MEAQPARRLFEEFPRHGSSTNSRFRYADYRTWERTGYEPQEREHVLILGSARNYVVLAVDQSVASAYVIPLGDIDGDDAPEWVKFWRILPAGRLETTDD
jgi:hypothetical protein